MMETKLWAAALCALLLVNSGSADHNENPTAAATAAVTEAGPGPEATHSEPDPTVDPTSHGLNISHPHSSLNGTSGFGNNTTTNPEVTAVTSRREESVNQTTQPPSHPPRPTSVDPPSVPHTPDSTTVVSPTHAHTLSVDVTVTRSPGDNTSHNPAPALPDSSSNPLNQPNSTSSTLVPTSKSPVPERTSVTLSARPTSTSSTTSSPQPHSSPSSTPTSPSDSHPGTITKAQSTTITITTTTTTTTTKSPYGPSAQAKTHTEDSSQLNVGNDPTMVHDSPTLDPLLAGLVSAFIITAVIITLLLFLKLRRRDNRPEFRRLQDLPMDDMMEDTPLSMYSY